MSAGSRDQHALAAIAPSRDCDVMDYYSQVKEAAERDRESGPRGAADRGRARIGPGRLCRAASADSVSMPLRRSAALAGVRRGRSRRPTGGRHWSAAGRSPRCPDALTLYEGHDMRTVTFAVRALGVLGVKTLILTNAAGGVNTGFAQGALMVIDDHINLMGGNPLVGAERRALRPALSRHDGGLLAAPARASPTKPAASSGVTLPHGVYAGLLGPSYETPAEIRYLRTIGADAVGMSTVPEAIAARHMGIEVLGHLVHHQHGRRRAAAAARSPRGDGDGAPRARTVRRAAGGHHWPHLTRLVCRSSS